MKYFLQNHCQQFLDHSLAKKLTDKFSVKNQRGTAVVAIQEFLKFLSEILGGSIEDKSKCMVTIAGGKGATSLTNVELLQVIFHQLKVNRWVESRLLLLASGNPAAQP